MSEERLRGGGRLYMLEKTPVMQMAALKTCATPGCDQPRMRRPLGKNGTLQGYKAYCVQHDRQRFLASERRKQLREFSKSLRPPNTEPCIREEMSFEPETESEENIILIDNPSFHRTIVPPPTESPTTLIDASVSFRAPPPPPDINLLPSSNDDNEVIEDARKDDRVAPISSSSSSSPVYTTGLKDDIETILNDLGLSKYVPMFKEHEIDRGALLLMKEGNFIQLGIPLGPGLKLLRYIEDNRPPSVADTNTKKALVSGGKVLIRFPGS